MAVKDTYRWHYPVLFAVAIMLYANTLQHGFVLDDEVVIVRNQYVKDATTSLSGIIRLFLQDSFSGYERINSQASVMEGGRYRPLSLFVFALLNAAFGLNTFAFHLFAVFLYAFTGVALYKLVRLLFKDYAEGIWLAFTTALIFIVHPIHTEVVANIKSCDEQLCLLFGLLSLHHFLKYFDDVNNKSKWIAGLFFLLACLAKENAITLIVIAPLMVIYFRNAKLRVTLLNSLPLVIAGVLFFTLRFLAVGTDMGGSVMHDPLNNPFMYWNGNGWSPASLADKSATIIYTLGYYIKLLILPFPLTHDYYPFHVALKNFAHPMVILSLILLAAAGAYSIRSLKNKAPTGFAILFFLLTISITANIFFTVGTPMAERFLYLPSVGFSLLVGAILFQKKSNLKIALPLLFVVCAIFATLTMVRNKAWKDNETLLYSALKVSEKSVKLRNDLGTVVLTKALQTSDLSEQTKLLEESSLHLQYAIDHHKTYYDAYLASGAASFYLGNYQASVDAYKHAYRLFPQSEQAETGLLYALQGYGMDRGKKGDTASAIALLNEAWHVRPDTTTAIELSGYYSLVNENELVIEWLRKAATLAPQNVRLNTRLANAYHAVGDNAAADSIRSTLKTMHK